MKYKGSAVQLHELESGIMELIFDREDHAINKLDRKTFSELEVVIGMLNSQSHAKGLLVSSAKEYFIVGADVAELAEIFKQPEKGIISYISGIHALLNKVEDLPFPTVTAINGLALGGGFEICLATDYRVMASNTSVGQPEVNFGIIPGYGGTVRLSRLIGAEDAIEWISSGAYKNAAAALAVGAVDAVVELDVLREAALDLLNKCIKGRVQYKQKRLEKLQPLLLDEIESQIAFDVAKGMVARKMPVGNTAPMVAVETIQNHAALARDEALDVEARMVSRIARKPVVSNLIGTFLSEQQLDKRQKKLIRGTNRVETAAVLGAGVMGGGIAYQSALKGIPIIVKDIEEESIKIALDRANELVTKRVQRKRMTPDKMGRVLNNIRPTLQYGDFDNIDFVIEAVTEKLEVKVAVLKDCEQKVSENTVIASNTSTISISRLAQSLQRPENFCGMHFFNPVDKMLLVEVIRGKKSNAETIARTVAYALSLGKKPIVVEDCPGFLVNRILFPYVFAFLKLLQEGIQFESIDKAMTSFGWPMGPALLCDIVGIDVLIHASSVMADGYPDRMSTDYHTALQVLIDNDRLGQKSGRGFYKHDVDKRGWPKLTIDENIFDLLSPYCNKNRDMDHDEIIKRMMLPLCIEAVRCLEEGIVETATNLDLALIYGIGFPPSHGGALRYIENMGLKEFIALTDRYTSLGEAYHPPQKLRLMAKQQRLFTR